MSISAPTADLRRHCNAFARARDARVLWLLDTHPVTAAMLVRIGLFPTAAKARKRLRRLAGRRRIRIVGVAHHTNGRPAQVFCRWRVPADQVQHELELTEVCLRIDAGIIRRGPHVVDHERRPDAEVWINGDVYHLELDRGTTGYDRIVSDRFRTYRDSPHLSLWVCPTDARRDGLRARAEGIRQTAIFTTFAAALANPHDRIWMDYAGACVALPRERGATSGDPSRVER